MLGLPLWKWAALVESWIWRHVPDEEAHARVSNDLERQVDFTWMRGKSEPGRGVLKEPSAWQTNKPGENLLSKHARGD